MKRYLAVALGVLLLAAPGAFAQIRTGNIYGTVADAQGGVLPGVTVTLSGELGTRTAVSSSQGEFRFLALDSGRYTLTVALAGFGTTTREVVVTAGENVNLPFALKVAGVQETVEVMGETPLVDVKKRGTSTTMIADELQKMPNARDPWGVLKNVPGVMLDRMNIAGNENGQQANAGAKGSIEGDKMWSVDGLVVTDMTATGGSPSYFDFDAFQEIAVTTGGADLQVQAGGIGINLVTKRGTNKFHGGARGFLTHDDLQSSNLPAALVGDPRLENPDGTLPRQGRPHPADQRLRVRPRRPHHQGQAVVLRELGQAGHPARAPGRNHGQHAAHVVQREAELAGHEQHDGLGVLLRRRQVEDRPQPGVRPQRAGHLPLGPGERLRGGPAARAVEARGEPDLLAELLRDRPRPPTTTPASA